MERGMEIWDAFHQAQYSHVIDFQGKHIQLDNVELSIVPYQKPIPTFAVGNAPEVRKRMLERGVTPLCGLGSQPPEFLKILRGLLSETAAELDIKDSDLNRGNVIVDSGTTDTYFTRALTAPFNKVWKELTGKAYNHNPVQLTEKEIAELPTIILVMGGFDGDSPNEPDGNPNDVANYVGDVNDLSSNPKDVVIAIPAAHYMEFDPDTGKYVPRFYTEEASGSVLGANAMMGHDVYFDIARGRIGFAESNCDYVSLLLSEGTSISIPPTKKVSTAKTEVPAAEEEEVEESEEPAAEEEEEAVAEVYDIEQPEEESPIVENEPIPPPPDQSENAESTPYELFGDKQGSKNNDGGGEGILAEILDDMKHECSSAGCRGIAALFILGAMAVVLAGIRKAMARRRVIRQYQEAELEISDLALDSDSDDDDEGGYVDEPRTHQIT